MHRPALARRIAKFLRLGDHEVTTSSAMTYAAPIMRGTNMPSEEVTRRARRDDNTIRAYWALAAVAGMASETGSEHESLESSVGDLLANLLHLCDSADLNMDELVSDAYVTYDREVHLL